MEIRLPLSKIEISPLLNRSIPQPMSAKLTSVSGGAPLDSPPTRALSVSVAVNLDVRVAAIDRLLRGGAGIPHAAGHGVPREGATRVAGARKVLPDHRLGNPPRVGKRRVQRAHRARAVKATSRKVGAEARFARAERHRCRTGRSAPTEQILAERLAHRLRTGVRRGDDRAVQADRLPLRKWAFKKDSPGSPPHRSSASGESSRPRSLVCPATSAIAASARRTVPGMSSGNAQRRASSIPSMSQKIALECGPGPFFRLEPVPVPMLSSMQLGRTSSATHQNQNHPIPDHFTLGLQKLSHAVPLSSTDRCSDTPKTDRSPRLRRRLRPNPLLSYWLPEPTKSQLVSAIVGRNAARDTVSPFICHMMF